MSHTDFLAAARVLLATPTPETAGLWGRAAAILIRHELELTLTRLWARKAPGLHYAPFTAQLLCLPRFTDADLSAEIAWTWHALSRATHYHADPIPPAAPALAVWMEAVERFRARIG